MMKKNSVVWSEFFATVALPSPLVNERDRRLKLLRRGIKNSRLLTRSFRKTTPTL
jgi:hypothetical protein